MIYSHLADGPTNQILGLGADVAHSHFAYGWINPIMGFGFALAGSFLGLTCMVQARNRPKGRERLRWLVYASLAIGGTGIWMMHFIAMIGFTVADSVVRYDTGITAASLVISILSVAFGIFVIGAGDASVAKIAIGGPLTGLGVVAMHYTGMAAVNLSGKLHYDPVWVIASVVIAIVAAAVALFFTTWVRGRGSLVLASLIMAVAVCGMHYTGMGSVSVELINDTRKVEGVDPLLLLIPILIVATIVLIALIFGVLGGKEESSIETRAADLAARPRSDRRPSDSPTPGAPGFWSGDEPSGAARPEPATARNAGAQSDPDGPPRPGAAAAAAAAATRRREAGRPLPKRDAGENTPPRSTLWDDEPSQVSADWK